MQNPVFDHEGGGLDPRRYEWWRNGGVEAGRRVETANWRRFTVEQQIRYGIGPAVNPPADALVADNIYIRYYMID